MTSTTLMHSRTTLTVAIAIALGGLVTGAQAQVLDEVVVTAQKREQNLQDVGISVAVVTGEAIREQAVSSTIDAVTKVPNVTNYSPYGPGSSANIVIRGIGLNDFGEGHEAPVTAYVDEFYLVSVPAVDFSMYDLARVEVLRGPQGTLFGRNSTGGLVHFVTARPTSDYEGFVQASGARFNDYRFEGAVSGPISDHLSFRLSGLTHHSDGYVKSANPAFKPAGQAGTDAVRGQVLWTGDGGLSILGKIEYAHVDVRHTYYEQTPAAADAANGGLYSLQPGGTDGAGYNQLTFGGGRAAGRNVADVSSPSTLDSEGITAMLRIEKDFGAVTLTSLSGYLDMDRQLQEDCDASPNTICFADFPYESKTFTQELRWSKSEGATRWTAGLYYLDSQADNTPSATFNVPVGGPGAVSPTTGLYDGPVFPIALGANWTLDTKSYSVFGQLEHDLGAAVTLIAGARVTRDKKDFDERDNASLRSCIGFPIPSNCFDNYTANPYRGKYRKTLFSGKLELDWRPANGVLVYGSVSRGSKAGGFNNGFYPGGMSADRIPYGDESMYAFELGTKTTLADGRIRLNGSVFYYDYSDFQVFNWEGIGGLIVNRDANALGAEVELEAALADGLTATVAVSGLDTKIKNLNLRNGVTVRDTDMSMAPDFMASGSLRYTVPVGAGHVTALWDFNYSDSRFTNNFNDPASRLESYFKHNARLAYAPNESLEVAAYVLNIGDKRNTTKVFVFDSLGYAQTIYAQPRTYGMQVSYRW